MSEQQPTQHQAPTTGPSRDMFGGPWLGVIAFVVIAVGLGWGVTWFFQQAQRLGDEMSVALDDEFRHDFNPDAVYTLQRGLLLGFTADGRRTLFPARDDLPHTADGRRQVPTLEQVRETPGEYPDLIGVVEPGTRVKFVELIEQPENPQTRILLRVELLDGPYASPIPVLGMHLESTDLRQHEEHDAEVSVYVPSPDLFAPAGLGATPVQSPAPTDP